MIRRILVATDGSGHARKAIDCASDLALRYEATVYLLHVIHKSGAPESLLKVIEAHRREEKAEETILQEIGDRIIRAAETEVKKKGVKDFQSFLIEGDPAERIIEFARQESVDMILLGGRGLSSLEEVFLGSVSHKVCHPADRTCVTVK